MSAQTEIEVVEQDPYLAPTLVDATIFVRDFLRNKYPTLDLQPTRVIYDLLVRPTAEVHAYDQTNLNRYRQASSLQAMMADPTLVAEGDVDRICANFGVVRQPGSVSAGNITIIMDSDLIVSVPIGATFVADGLIYTAPQTYIATPGPLTASFERLLVRLDDGTYSFTIAVQASTAGVAYSAKGDTPFTWQQPATGYLRAFADGDFTGGSNPESNEDLLNRLNSGLAAKAMAGRMNIEALLRYTFPGIKDVSIIGAGDPEMLRDSHNIFAYKTGGKADIVVRSAEQIINKVITKSCTLLDKTEKLFQASLSRDDYPGFYVINQVLPETSNNLGGTVQIVSEIRSVDLTNLPYVGPDIQNIVEGAYTRFQTAVVQIKDPSADVTSLNVGETKNYKFELAGLPLIDDMQDYVSTRDVRNPEGDYLVRAPIPMLVSVSVQIDYIRGDPAIDEGAVKAAIAKAINTVGFIPGRLSSSLIVDAVQSLLQGKTTVHEPIDMMAVLRLPSGDVRLYRSSTGIDVPDITDEGVSSRVVSFFTDVTAVALNIVTIATKSV